MLCLYMNVHLEWNKYCKLTVPVFAAIDGDNMLCGVEELFAIVRPGQGPGCRIGIQFYFEAQALPLFNISMDWTWAS